jgi:hypothetical protein
MASCAAPTGAIVLAVLNRYLNPRLAARLAKDPPIIATNFSGGAGTPNAFPSYDLLGRQAFVGFTAKF